MKKRILSALLLAAALVVAPVGGMLSMVATASSNSWSPYPYMCANNELPQVSSGKITVQEAVHLLSTIGNQNWYCGYISVAASACFYFAYTGGKI